MPVTGVFLVLMLLAAPIARAAPVGPGGLPLPATIPLAAAFDATGVAPLTPAAAGFDGQGRAFTRAGFPAGRFVDNAIPYRMSAATATGYDNIAAHGQTLRLPHGHDTGGYLLVAAPGGFAGSLTVRYADGTAATERIDVADWKTPNVNDIAGPLRIAGLPDDPPGLRGYLEAQRFAVDQTRTVVALQLPPVAAAGQTLHVFALTLVPRLAQERGAAVAVVAARASTRRVPGIARGQMVDVTVANVGSVPLTAARPARIVVRGPGLRTVAPARVTALAPGERIVIEVPVASAGAPLGSSDIAATVIARVGDGPARRLPLRFRPAPRRYDAANLQTHEAPDWFRAAKFGIFIHWGVYSVPAFSRVGDYAEWYWQWIHRPGSLAYEHQLDVYGPHSTYDGFIDRFRAQRFDPRAWVDLFARAGARYFVLTAKHHEGFALFATRTTNRNAAVLGPHRDLVDALFRVARRYQPRLHPAVYYSLYEWYNPAYTGHPVPGWYDGKPTPYAGAKPVRSYVDDVALPQLRELIDRERPDLIWCDGEWEQPHTYWHDAATFAHYYNAAAARGREVAIDDRCRTSDDERDGHDFYTPEYATFATTVERKWEANRGMGYSYGYNAAERPQDYKSATDLIDSLVDIVSKNGNLLLDIGPRADGTIPAIMRDRLTAIGDWLHVNGEAIYATQPWWQTSEDGDLRFTVRPSGAFYVISLRRPGARVIVHPPVPIAPGDTIALLGWNRGHLRWRRERGYLVIDVPPAARASGAHAWTFALRPARG